ncbi:MAG: hypothetical protein WCS88_00670 [Patescibacteria group bacterium]|jgi:hypothetical protein
MLNEQEVGKEEPKAGIVFDSKGSLKKEVINVHPMPSKFVEMAQQTGHLSHSKGKNGRKIILIAIVLVLIIVVVIAGIIYFTNKNVPVVNTNTNTNEADNANTNINENTNTNTNTNEADNTNININENTNTNANTNTNEDDNTNANSNENPNIQASLDIDNDGLSYEEELIFGTNPELEDTDKDGYRDGQEIISLYNPLVPAQGLEASGVVTRFKNGSYNYSLLRPSAWLINPVGEGLGQIIILANSETGEAFSIDASVNADNKSLEQILTDKADVLGPLSIYQNYSLAGQEAYRSIDGKIVLTLKDNFIFIISHNTDSFGGVNFTNTFEMLLNSLEWTEASIQDI